MIWILGVVLAAPILVTLAIILRRKEDERIYKLIGLELRRRDGIARWHDGPITKCGYCFRDFDARAPMCPHCKEPPDLLPMTVEEWEADCEARFRVWHENQKVVKN